MYRKVNATTACHPANNHIFNHIMKLQSQAQKRFNSNKNKIYSKALKSLANYPLPILCGSQAKCLMGFGDKLAQMIEKLNHKKYSKYLIGQRNQGDKASYNGLKREQCQENGQSTLQNGKGKKQTLDNKGVYHHILDQKLQGDRLLEVEKEPRIGSCPSLSLITFLLVKEKREEFIQGNSTYDLKAPTALPVHEVFANATSWVHKDHLKLAYTQHLTQLNSLQHIKIPPFKTHLNKLWQNKMLYMFEDNYQLTELGEKVAQSHLYVINNTHTDKEKVAFLKKIKDEGYLAKSASKFSLSDKYEYKYEPENYQFKSQEDIRKRNKELKDIYGVVGHKNRRALQYVSIKDNFKPEVNKYTPFVIEKAKVARIKLILEVDIREKRNRGEAQNFFEQRLKRAGLSVELALLPIGDFMWSIEIEDMNGLVTKCVTDYIIERKKIDDLAASIVDGRYYDQKNRLKISGLKKVIYLVEGQKSKHCNVGDQVLEGAIASTRCFHRFMVHKTVNSQDSLNFLVSMHGKIQKLIDRKKDFLEFPARYDEFTCQQKRSDTMTVGKIFGSMLSTLKGFGPETLLKITNAFSTLREFYEFMRRDDNFTEKLNLLDQFNKKQSELLIKTFDPENIEKYFTEKEATKKRRAEEKKRKAKEERARKAAMKKRLKELQKEDKKKFTNIDLD